MNIRWLFGNFSDPQYDLSRAEQRELTALAHRKYLPPRVLIVWTVAVMLLPMWPMYRLVMPAVLGWLGFGGDTTAHLVASAVIVLLFWPYSAWMYRSIYIRPMRMAMREKGYDLCVACGYDLRGTEAGIDRCPECGVERFGATGAGPQK